MPLFPRVSRQHRGAPSARHWVALSRSGRGEMEARNVNEDIHIDTDDICDENDVGVLYSYIEWRRHTPPFILFTMIYTLHHKVWWTSDKMDDYNHGNIHWLTWINMSAMTKEMKRRGQKQVEDMPRFEIWNTTINLIWQGQGVSDDKGWLGHGKCQVWQQQGQGIHWGEYNYINFMRMGNSSSIAVAVAVALILVVVAICNCSISRIISSISSVCLYW